MANTQKKRERPPKIERGRIEIRMPVSIIKQIDTYQKNNNLVTRTATIIELIRKGLAKSN